MKGEIALLNVGTGDTKLSFDPEDKEGMARTAMIVKDMIRKGYALLVEVGKDEKGPLYRRAYDFDADTNEYIVAGVPADENTQLTQEEKPRAASRKRTKTASQRAKRTERIPATGRKAVAVPRTAGG